MKAYEADGGTTFHYTDIDLSEDVLIIASDKREIYIPASDILDFVANIVRAKLIQAAENMTTNEVLFGGES